MSTDFGALLYASLPDLYRDKDAGGSLRRFLELAALPLVELEQSIEALLDDLFVTTARPELIPFLGALVGAEVDAGAPPQAQREQVQDAVRFYRAKGLSEPLGRYCEQLTGWRVATVDMSHRVARTPFLDGTIPVRRLREQPVGEDPAGSRRFTFREDRARQPLFDGLTGRAITRTALAADPAAYAGVNGRFTIRDRGQDVFAGPAPLSTAVAADLTSFASPKTPAGGALTVQGTQVAIDPELGRFLAAMALLAGNLRVTYQALAPADLPAQTLGLRDPRPLRRLGRSDDPVPVSLDLRAPKTVTEHVGLQHFDNHGIFCTPCAVIANRRPSLVGPGQFTFDDRAQPVALQLLDGIDGAPLTRKRLAGSEALYSGSPRGFTIRVGGVDVSDPARSPRLRVLAGNLDDFAQPRNAAGNVVALTATDVMIDPQLGRFRLDPALTADAVRVDYLLGLAVPVMDAAPRLVDPAAPLLFAFGPDDERSRPVDAYDGTSLEDALRLGRLITSYHLSDRGWRIRLDGTPVSTAIVQTDLSSAAAAPPAGKLGIDPEHGRFRFPAGTVASVERLSVDYAFADPDRVAERFGSLAQHLPRALPAGVVGVVTDTRRRPADAVNLA